jgi:hypothetical protein
MPSGCCGGNTCSCQMIGQGGITIEGSGLPSDPFILDAATYHTDSNNGQFLTTAVGTGSSADPYAIEVDYAPQARLDDIPNVDTPSPSNGYVLTWDSSTNTWVASPPAVAPVGAVVHDTSLSGDGSAATPLAVVAHQARYIGVSASGVGLNDNGMVAVVHHFTNDAARFASIPFPTANMLSMLETDPGIVFYWDGTNWSRPPNQTGWVASDALLELSGAYTVGVPITMGIYQVDTTTDANGVFDVLGLADLAGRSGVLSVQVQETGDVAWQAMVFDNTDRISATAYRLTDGTVMAGTPITCSVNAVMY